MANNIDVSDEQYRQIHNLIDKMSDILDGNDVGVVLCALRYHLELGILELPTEKARSLINEICRQILAHVAERTKH
jgi:hypothetical protein